MITNTKNQTAYKCKFCGEHLLYVNRMVCVCKNDKCKAWGVPYPEFIAKELDKQHVSKQLFDTTFEALVENLNTIQNALDPTTIDDILLKQSEKNKVWLLNITNLIQKENKDGIQE